MLRQEHYEKGRQIVGTDDFDRIFMVHAIEQRVRDSQSAILLGYRIYFLTIRELVDDLLSWYRTHQRPTALRNTIMGDLFHLLVGFCQLNRSAPSHWNAASG
jgi:hypothetical protein